MSIDSYYFSFKETGVRDIDRLLYTIAQAGKCFHCTSQWTEETSWKPLDTDLIGDNPIEWIQNAANDLAKTLEKRKWK